MATKKAAPAAKKSRAAKAAPVAKDVTTVTVREDALDDIDLFAGPGEPMTLLPEVTPLTLKVKRLHDDAKLPVYATDGSACFDIHTDEQFSLLPGQSRAFTTGLKVEVPPGYALLVYSRSGHGFKNGVRLVNSVGIIDSDYRGELAVGLRNEGSDLFIVHPGDRIAQGMLIPVPAVQIVEVDELNATERGEGGFGSTGA